MDYLKYNYQSLSSTREKICVGGFRLFYFRDDGKLDIYSLLKYIPCYLKYISVLFVKCTEINCKGTDENGLCVSIFLKNMGWYLVVIGKLQNDECLVYIFTSKIQNGITGIFNKTLYHC